MNKNGYRYEKSCCYFHPKHEVVGVCPLCLNERLLVRPDSQHWKSQTYQYDDSSPSPEESFISIKFEKNGMASWEKNSAATTTNNTRESKNKVPPETTKSVIEHGKSRDTLRWRKKIGHIFHLMRWKRPTTKSSAEGGTKKVRKGWMRTSLTQRRTME
ncbi:hypothetical protein K1719_015732 [Acacia pycnantha]|nr:hypothetical protein K1719_015732 [Acacia pycnantha]